jgi:predicted ATP-dependent serine protease
MKKCDWCDNIKQNEYGMCPNCHRFPKINNVSMEQPEVKNLVNELRLKFPKQIKDYGITEIFIVDGEIHVTSNYDLPSDFTEMLEKEII